MILGNEASEDITLKGENAVNKHFHFPTIVLTL